MDVTQITKAPQVRSTAPVEPAPAPTPQPAAPIVDGSGVNPAIQRDARTGVDVVQFRDNDTGEVVSQLPTKAVLALMSVGRASERRGGTR